MPMALKRLPVMATTLLIEVRAFSETISIDRVLIIGLAIFISEDLKKKLMVIMIIPWGKEIESKKGMLRS